MTQEQKDALAVASGFMQASGFPDVALTLWRLIPGCESHERPGGMFHIETAEEHEGRMMRAAIKRENL